MQSVPTTTNIVNSNSAQLRCTWYNIMWLSLSVTCAKSVVFSRYSISSINKTDRHDRTETLLKVALNTITLITNPKLMRLYKGMKLYIYKRMRIENWIKDKIWKRRKYNMTKRSATFNPWLLSSVKKNLIIF